MSPRAAGWKRVWNTSCSAATTNRAPTIVNGTVIGERSGGFLFLLVESFEAAYRWPVQHMSIRCKARSMTRTVPRFLHCIPRHDAAKVGAYSRVPAQCSIVTAMACHWHAGLSDDCAFSGTYLFWGIDIAASDPVHVLRADIQVFTRPFAECPERLASGIIELSPGILTALDQVGKEYSRNGAMRHSHAAITGRNVDVVLVRVSANECKIVIGLHHLPRPSEIDGFDSCEPLASPVLESAEVLLRMVILTGLVVLASDDENVAFLVHTALAGMQPLHPDVVIWIKCVPKEGWFHASQRDADANHIAAICHLLGVRNEAVIYRTIGGNHQPPRCDRVTTFSADARWRSV